MKKIIVFMLCVVMAGSVFAELPKGVNLLLNPGFEDFADALDPWTPESGGASIAVSSDALSGLQSAEVSYPADDNRGIRQHVALSPEDTQQTYRLTFSIKSVQDKPVIFRAAIWEAPTASAGWAFNQSDWMWMSTEWQTVSYEVKLKKVDTELLRIVIYAAPQDNPKTAGQFLVDDVVLMKPVPTATLVAPTPDGIDGVDLTTTLEWTPADVSAYPEDDPNGFATRTGQLVFIQADDPDFSGVTPTALGAADTTLEVGPLAEYTTYYWAVNTETDIEPNALPGTVWSFTTKGSISINGQPVGGYFDAGSEVALSLDAVPGGMTYSWYRSDDRIADAGDAPVGTDSSVLSVASSASASDEGYYYCIVTDGFDVVTSDVVWVGVKRLAGQWKLDGNFQDAISGPDGWTGTIIDADTGLAAEPNWIEGADLTVVDGGHEFITDHDYIEISGSGAAGVFNFYPQGLTVSAWVQRYNDGTWGMIAGKAQLPDTPSAGDPWTGYALAITANNNLLLVFRTDTGGLPSNGTIMADGKWHFVAGTFDVNTKETSVYIDGKLDRTVTSIDTEVSEAQIGRMTTDLVIGAEDFRGLTAYHNGVIDDVRIYNYPLTEAEIADLYYAFDYYHCDNPINAAADVNGDCKIDIQDFAEMAGAWMECGRIPVEKCYL